MKAATLLLAAASLAGAIAIAQASGPREFPVASPTSSDGASSAVPHNPSQAQAMRAAHTFDGPLQVDVPAVAHAGGLTVYGTS